MEKYNFYAGIGQLSDMYHINMTEDEYENIGMLAWDHIGNKEYRTHLYYGLVRDHKLELPCNVSKVEAITSLGEPQLYGYSDNAIVTDHYYWLEYFRNNTSFEYTTGTYIKYEQVDNTLYFKTNNMLVKILYKGIQLDENGLPSLNFKELDAITKYCAWIYNQRQAMVTKDKSTFEFAQMMMQQWQRACDDARTPIEMSQNDWDQLLDVQSSWDRKRFGKSYKPIR